MQLVLMLLARKLLANSARKDAAGFGLDCWLCPSRRHPAHYWSLVGFGFARDPLSLSLVCEQAGFEGEDGGCWDQTANGGCSVPGAGLQEKMDVLRLLLPVP